MNFFLVLVDYIFTVQPDQFTEARYTTITVLEFFSSD